MSVRLRVVDGRGYQGKHQTETISSSESILFPTLAENESPGRNSLRTLNILFGEIRYNEVEEGFHIIF